MSPTIKSEKVDCKNPTIPEDVCNLENPFGDMFEYQNECIELKKPFITFFFTPLMGAGDIYRESALFKPSLAYLDEQINMRLEAVNGWSEYQINRISEALTPLKVQDLKKFQQKVEEWESFTNNHPICDMPIKRKLQLKAIEAEKIIVNYGLALAEASSKEAKLFITDLLRTQINTIRDELNELVEKAEKETRKMIQRKKRRRKKNE